MGEALLLLVNLRRGPAPARPAPVAAAPALRTSCAWMLAGNVTYAGCQWGAVLALAKLGSPEMVGQFALALAVTTPVILFAGLQLRGVLATDALGQYAFGDYLSLTLATTALALGVIAGLAFLGGHPRPTALVIVAVGLGKGFDAVSEVFYGLFQQHERLDRVARALMVNGVFSLLALGGLVYLTGGVFWGAVGWAAASALTLLACNLPGAVRLAAGAPASPQPPRPALPRRLLGLAWLALSLGLVALLLSLNANLPRYFIDRYAGAGSLGIFAAVAYLMTVGNTVVTALGQSASPRLARLYAAGDRAGFRGLLFRLTGLVALGGVLGVLLALLVGRQVLALLYTPEYARDPLLLVGLAVAAGVGFVCSVLGYAMTAARYLRVQPPLFAAVGLVTALASAALIPRRGLPGAALALVLAALFQLAGSAGVVAHALRGGRGEEGS